METKSPVLCGMSWGREVIRSGQAEGSSSAGVITLEPEELFMILGTMLRAFLGRGAREITSAYTPDLVGRWWWCLLHSGQ